MNEENEQPLNYIIVYTN